MENPVLQGALYVKKDTEIVTPTFKKREFVIETFGQFPQKIPFELTQDNTGLIDNIPLGTVINVHFNMRGTENKKEGQEARFFLKLQAWRIS